MAFLQAAANKGSLPTGYDIEHSLKLEQGSNEWLYRASPTAGNRKKHTFSFWIKRTTLGNPTASGTMYVMGQGQHGRMHFSSDFLQYRFDDGHDVRDVTTKHRDASAWLHVVVAVDTNQSSSTNRVKIFYNGVQTTTLDYDGGSQPDQEDSASGWFTGNYLTIGTAPFGGSYNAGDGDYDMSGLLSEVVAIDGLQLAPTSFGEYDAASGIWKPKDVSDLTFGDEGFYLNFSNASNLGEDFSGNDNDFASSNVAAADQATDTPTNNFCTMTPLFVYENKQGITQGGTKTLNGGQSAWQGAKAGMGVTKGKWYWEYKTLGGNHTDIIVGIQTDEGVALTGNAHNIISTAAWYIGGEFWVKDVTNGRNSVDVTINSTASGSHTYGFALDMDSSTQRISVYQNNSVINAGDDINIDGLGDKTVFPFAACYLNNGITYNFGGYTVNSISSAASDANGYGTFEYAPPSGYYAICSKNLAQYGG